VSRRSALRAIGVVALAAWLDAADAPWLAYAYPAGGAAGSTVSIAVAGERIVGATATHITGSGVSVRLLTPPTAPADAQGKPKKRNQTVMDEVGAVELVIAADAEPGPRSLRLLTPEGPTNPRTVIIGRAPELADAAGGEAGGRRPVAVPALPVTLNGQLLSGETDRWILPGRAGVPLGVVVAARALIPYIADAVPGWCQPLLTLRDAAGREMASADGDGFRQDAVLTWTPPADGPLTLEVRDALWRGRADFIYRLTVGDPPPRAVAPPPPEGWQLIELAAGAAWEATFPGRAGAAWEGSVRARRLGSPLDARLELLGPDGAVVASADDSTDRAEGLATHHADPELLATLPADGTYRVRVADLLGRGGAGWFAQVYAGAPRPRHALLVAPSSLALPAGGSVPLTIHAQRRGGFSGAIPLRLAEAAGVVLDQATIPAGADRVQATLSAPADLVPGVLAPRLLSDGAEAVWSDDAMQAFLWMQLVPAAGPAVQVLPAAALRVRPLTPEVMVEPGRSTRIAVAVERASGWDGPVRISLHQPPPGVSLRNGQIKAGASEGRFEIVLAADAVVPAGNLIARATVTREDGVRPDGKPKRVTQSVWLPAIRLVGAAP
jgi:hypothetical protein